MSHDTDDYLLHYYKNCFPAALLFLVFGGCSFPTYLTLILPFNLLTEDE